MSQLTYTITEFNSETKQLKVEFLEDGWAIIQLANPLPANKAELELIIKQYALSKEAKDAQLTPNADISYIANLVGVQSTCDRLQINTTTPTVEVNEEALDLLEQAENKKFKDKLIAELISLGVLNADQPTV